MLLISFIFFLSSSSHLSCSFYSSTTSRSSQDTLANLLKKFEIESFKLFWKGFNSEKEREGQAIGWEGPTLWAAIISSYQFSRLIEAVIKFNPFLPNHPYRSTPIAPIHRSRIFHDWLRPQIPRFLSCGISLALDLTLDLTNFVLIFFPAAGRDQSNHWFVASFKWTPLWNKNPFKFAAFGDLGLGSEGNQK